MSGMEIRLRGNDFQFDGIAEAVNLAIDIGGKMLNLTGCPNGFAYANFTRWGTQNPFYFLNVADIPMSACRPVNCSEHADLASDLSKSIDDLAHLAGQESWSLFEIRRHESGVYYIQLAVN